MNEGKEKKKKRMKNTGTYFKKYILNAPNRWLCKNSQSHFTVSLRIDCFAVAMQRARGTTTSTTSLEKKILL